MKQGTNNVTVIGVKNIADIIHSRPDRVIKSFGVSRKISQPREKPL
jgi:hypothetical protein